MIEIVVQHAGPDKRDDLLVHEICHAVTNGSHGKAWQRRMEIAARRADELGRAVAKLLRQKSRCPSESVSTCYPDPS